MTYTPSQKLCDLQTANVTPTVCTCNPFPQLTLCFLNTNDLLRGRTRAMLNLLVCVSSEHVWFCLRGKLTQKYSSALQRQRTCVKVVDASHIMNVYPDANTFYTLVYTVTKQQIDDFKQWMGDKTSLCATLLAEHSSFTFHQNLDFGTHLLLKRKTTHPFLSKF